MNVATGNVDAVTRRRLENAQGDRIDSGGDEATFGVHDLGDLRPVVLDRTEERGVLEVEHGYVVGHLGLEVGKIDQTRLRVHLDGDERGHR